MMWNRTLPVRGLLAMLTVAALTVPAAAQYVPGSGELDAKDKLIAKGCGRATLVGPQTLEFDGDGTWTATDDGGGTLGGTFVPVGNKGRKFDLDFDAPSLTLFRTMLEEDLSELCQALVVLTTIDAKRFLLKLNRAGSKARVKAKFRLTGTADGQAGKATFKVKANGPWMAMPGSPSGAFLRE